LRLLCTACLANPQNEYLSLLKAYLEIKYLREELDLNQERFEKRRKEAESNLIDILRGIIND